MKLLITGSERKTGSTLIAITFSQTIKNKSTRYSSKGNSMMDHGF